MLLSTPQARKELKFPRKALFVNLQLHSRSRSTFQSLSKHLSLILYISSGLSNLNFNMATLRAEGLSNQRERRGSAGHRDSISVGQDAENFYTRSTREVPQEGPTRKKFVLCFDGTGMSSNAAKCHISNYIAGNKFSGTDADSNILKASLSKHYTTLEYH
jgi:hypothetical protein